MKFFSKPILLRMILYMIPLTSLLPKFETDVGTSTSNASIPRLPWILDYVEADNKDADHEIVFLS